MGRFFNEKVTNRNRGISSLGLIIIGVVIIVIIFIIVIIYNSGQTVKKADVTYTLKQFVPADLNGEMPTIEDFFEKDESGNIILSGVSVDNVTLDTSSVDLTKAGEYSAVLTIGSEEQKIVPVNVSDMSAPLLTLKEVTIKEGEEYTIDSFIESCTDNSGDECTYAYYEGVNEEAETTDYSKITDPGSYEILISASDKTGNTTEPISTTLTIEASEVEEPVEEPVDEPVEENTCTYGTLDYDKTKFPYELAVTVGNKTTKCAINYTKWEDEDVQKPATELFQKDYKNLQTDLYASTKFKEAFPTTASIEPVWNYIAIVNDNDPRGLVGYALYVKLYISKSGNASDKEDNLVASYYITSKGKRKYDYNKFNLD